MGQRNIKLIFIGFIFIFFSCGETIEHYKTDKDFVLISEMISNDKRFKIVEYQFNQGGLGYSRIFWAISPANYEKLNLREYMLPDGYKALSWTNDNEVLIEKWEPYYYREKDVELKTGDSFNGVKLRLNEK